MARTRRSSARDAKRKERSRSTLRALPPVWSGGQYKPLSDHDLSRIADTAFRILEEIGLRCEHEGFFKLAIENGATVRDENRLLFSRSYVEDAIDKAAKSIVLHGSTEEYDIDLGGERVHFATNGQTPFVWEYPTGTTRPAGLHDVYDFARLGDYCEHVHQLTQTKSHRSMKTTHTRRISMSAMRC